MNALLKHQILNAAADADRRKLPSLAAVLTDALAELERLAPFEPVTLFVAEPVVARRHEIASEQTDEMMAQGAPPIGYLAAHELGRLNSGHDANLRSAKFGPSALDGDVPVFLAAQMTNHERIELYELRGNLEQAAPVAVGDARDAARYREARKHAYSYGVGNPTPEQFDASVDAALASQAAPLAPDARHVGESHFEGWYQSYAANCEENPKQIARDAYAAGMGDTTPQPDAQQALEPVGAEDEEAIAKRLVDHNCKRVDYPETPGMTLYHTEIGRSGVYQLYRHEAVALYRNIGAALGYATPDADRGHPRACGPLRPRRNPLP